MADSKSTTPPPADMQSLMTQLGAAVPNTMITGSPIGGAAVKSASQTAPKR